MNLKKSAYRCCPICSSKSVEVLLHLPFTLPQNSPLPADYDVVTCDSCNFVYADTTGCQHDYDRYYHEYSKYEDPAVATGGSHQTHDKQRIEEQADRITANTSTSDNILDVGCAGGGLLLALRDRGYRAIHGVDGAQSCVEQLKDVGITANLLRFSELDERLFHEKYDLIILSHVLEHVVDIQPLLRHIRALLSDNGKIYIETPDASRYSTEEFVPNYFFDCEHINHFDTASLIKLAGTMQLFLSKQGETTIEIARNIHYPVCWVLLSKRNREICSAHETEKSSQLPESIRKYISDSNKMGAFPVLNALEASGEPIIVWGAGAFAQRLFSSTRIDKCNIVGIVDKDRNKQGKMFAGHKVSAPEILLPQHPDATLVIAAAVQFQAIAAEAQRISATCKIINLVDQ